MGQRTSTFRKLFLAGLLAAVSSLAFAETMEFITYYPSNQAAVVDPLDAEVERIRVGSEPFRNAAGIPPIGVAVVENKLGVGVTNPEFAFQVVNWPNYTPARDWANVAVFESRQDAPGSGVSTNGGWGTRLLLLRTDDSEPAGELGSFRYGWRTYADPVVRVTAAVRATMEAGGGTSLHFHTAPANGFSIGVYTGVDIGAQERMRIGPEGNVSIGLLNSADTLVWSFGLLDASQKPVGRLHVVGRNDLVDRMVFVPGRDTGASGAPGLRMGVGTTNPQGILHVQGYADRLEAVSFMPGLDDLSTQAKPELRLGIGTTQPAGLLHLATQEVNVPAELILASGDVGAVPANLGAVWFGSQKFGAARQSGIIGIAPGGWFSSGFTPAELAFLTSHPTINSNAPTEWMRINRLGFVGIGTSSPGTRLHIRVAPLGSGAPVNNSATILVDQRNPAGDPPALSFRHSNNGSPSDNGEKLGVISMAFTRVGGNSSLGASIESNLEDVSAQSANLQFYTMGSGTWGERMRIAPNGNVGIGTANPQGKLDVNGAIFQRGGSLHADYVFQPGYRLETIEEHGSFMWANRHLPAVGPARVDEAGLEVVEMGSHQRGMLEELEKAHIYIERLQKQNRQLEERLRKVEEQLNR